MLIQEYDLIRMQQGEAIAYV